MRKQKYLLRNVNKEGRMSFVKVDREVDSSSYVLTFLIAKALGLYLDTTLQYNDWVKYPAKLREELENHFWDILSRQ